MKLKASHNSLSYLPFRCSFLKPFRSMCECQNTGIFYQYINRGVRVFDFRFRVVEHEPVICHGLADFRGNIFWEAFEPLQSIFKIKNEDIYIQLVNEDTFHHSSKNDFLELVTIIRNRFPDFKYSVVSSKKNWEQSIELNEFPSEESFPCFWRSQDSLIPHPKQFSIEHNPENLKRYQEAQNGIWWFDFV